MGKKPKRSWESVFIKLEKLGAGGNAQVYRVQNSHTGEYCALKELVRFCDEKTSRFLSEIRIASENSKTIPGIIPVYLSNEEEFWYTMPIADKIMNVVFEMQVEDIILGTIQICETLTLLHAQGISHRDIKPANIYKYDGRFCLGDFGLVDFPDNLDHFTRSDRGLGAVFTIAPEMKRDPKSADGKKADVYSLAKTLWMFLSGDEKGFDGVYNHLDHNHCLRSYQKCAQIHLVEIEELLTDATCNNPDERPSIEDFGNRLKLWLDILKDDNKSQTSDWRFLQKQLFGNDVEIPSSAKWTKIESIVCVLNKIGNTPAYNHMFFSDGGGLDFSYAEAAPEPGCIYIYDTLGGCYLLNPKSLDYEGFDDIRWNYFILDMDKLAPVIAEPMGSSHERLVEDAPGHYVDAKDCVYGVYDYDTGIPLPTESKVVFRYTKGRLLLVMKWGLYNQIDAAYDGRHGKFVNCAAFRKYIDTLANTHSSFYSAIVQQEKGKNISQEEIDSYILNQEIFQRNPFSSRESQDTESERTKKVVDIIHKEEDFVCENLLKWNFSSLLIECNSENCLAKYFFVFLNPKRNGFQSFLDRKSLYLCQNGCVLELKESEEDQFFFVTDRNAAVKMKELLQIEIETQIANAGLESSRHFKDWVSIKMRRAGIPEHLFTKQEIEELMRTADDRSNNRLVIDENGYAHIIEGFGETPPYAVCHETWCAGNNYVGKYSPLHTLDDDYLLMLDGWSDYLRTGKPQKSDYLTREETEEKLLAKISPYYSVN